MNNYSAQVQVILKLAKEETERRKNDYVDTNHVLLALLVVDECTAQDMLMHADIKDFELLKKEFLGYFPEGKEDKPERSIGYNSRVMKILSQASKESRKLNDPTIDTEHVLLGLMCQIDDVVVTILHEMNFTYEVAVSTLLKIRESKHTVPKKMHASFQDLYRQEQKVSESYKKLYEDEKRLREAVQLNLASLRKTSSII